MANKRRKKHDVDPKMTHKVDFSVIIDRSLKRLLTFQG